MDRKLSSVSYNSYDTVSSINSINSNSLVYDTIQSTQVGTLFNVLKPLEACKIVETNNIFTYFNPTDKYKINVLTNIN